MNIAGYEHDVVLLADYLKVKADADRLAEALKRIAGQFECHACSDCTDIARAALAAHEELDGRA